MKVAGLTLALLMVMGCGGEEWECADLSQCGTLCVGTRIDASITITRPAVKRDGKVVREEKVWEEISYPQLPWEITNCYTLLAATYIVTCKSVEGYRCSPDSLVPLRKGSRFEVFFPYPK